MKRNKRFFAWLLFIGFILNGQAHSEAKAFILMDMDSGRVLYEKNADNRYAIASTTKIMTCLLALENSALSDQVTSSENASGVPGTSIYLSVGETLSMEQMLYGLMLRSGNDAAVAIAEHVAGSVEAFSFLMNERAKEIGADAYFTTPNGLDEGGNGASARGITLIARQALENEDFRRIVSTKKKTIPWADHEYERVLVNKNRLLTDYEGAMGVKTGYTKKAGRCLVFAAERDGLTLIGSVLNCPDWFDEAQRLLDRGFSEYEAKIILEKDQIVKSFFVAGREVRAISCETVKAAVREDESLKIRVRIDDLTLPIRKGQRIGEAKIYSEDQLIASTKLVSLDSHNKPAFRAAFQRVMSLWSLK